jgi:hemerythrin-like domain-containing protein
VLVTDRVKHGGTPRKGPPPPLPTPDRAVALSEQLIQVHHSLRERIATVRQQIAAGADGPAAVPEDLLSHCVGFCAALHTHHSGEDERLLPALRAASPALAPVIDNLIEDHRLVAGIMQRIRELLAPHRNPAAPAALIRELDGLTAILESHFSYEERRLASALDALGPSGWDADVFARHAWLWLPGQQRRVGGG